MLDFKTLQVPERFEFKEYYCGVGCAEMIVAHSCKKFDQSAVQIHATNCWITSPADLVAWINQAIDENLFVVHRLAGGNPAAGQRATILIAGSIKRGQPAVVASRDGAHWVVCDGLLWESREDKPPILLGLGSVDPELVDRPGDATWTWMDGQRFFHWTNEWVRTQVKAMSSATCKEPADCSEELQSVYVVAPAADKDLFKLPPEDYDENASILGESELLVLFPGAIAPFLSALERLLEVECGSIVITWSKVIADYWLVAVAADEGRELLVACRRQVPVGHGGLIFVMAGVRTNASGGPPRWLSDEPRELLSLLSTKPSWMTAIEWESLLAKLQIGQAAISSKLVVSQEFSKNLLFPVRHLQTKSASYVLTPAGRIVRRDTVARSNFFDVD